MASFFVIGSTMPAKLKVGRPATGETPKRAIRIADEDWEAANEAAGLEQISISEHVRNGLVKETKRVKDKHGIRTSAE